MKKAVLYARVSSDLQKKERTIDSQVVELKRQIAAAGDVLIREYIDDGFSGARLDRPALDELRNDLKTNLFETIYVLNTDRIAREVTYQTIIIAEILKHKKQIIINGVDYVHNPENKFTLTVLGAVAELERAKIVERVSRGKQLRLAQGFLLGCGANVYGYDYVRRTSISPPAYVINEKEAAVVRDIFATYAKGGVGMNQITRGLEERGVPTKEGNKLWRTSILKAMFRREMYTGVRYFNTVKRVREYANPLHGIKHSRSRIYKRPKDEWVGIKVPEIVPRVLFDKVQARLAWNKQHYRNPNQVQLLSSLIRCGSCGGSFFMYRRWCSQQRKRGKPYVYHKIAYKCNWRQRVLMHAKRSELTRCFNKEVKAELLEECVFKLIETFMLDAEQLKACMSFFSDETRVVQRQLEVELRKLDQRLIDTDAGKHRIIDVYASGYLSRQEYVRRCLGYDNEVNLLKAERAELVAKIPLLHKADVVELSIQKFCAGTSARFGSCTDFISKRQFLLDHVEKVVFWNDKVEVHGAVPVRLEEGDSETGNLPFQFSGRITREEMLASRQLQISEATISAAQGRSIAAAHRVARASRQLARHRETQKVLIGTRSSDRQHRS